MLTRLQLDRSGARRGQVEPSPSGWLLTAAPAQPGEDIVSVGADLEPGTLLAGYRAGLFPMGLGGGGTEPIGWWSPDPRGVLLPDGLHVSRSLRRSLRAFRLTVDTAFTEVMEACADPSRDGAWITDDVAAAYTRLHHLGWAHSVEVWSGKALVGGVYGVAVGRLFAGESMFHRVTDASKTALVGLVDLLAEDGEPWALDVQWQTPHLASLGVTEVPRTAYLRLVRTLAGGEVPSVWRAEGA